MATLERIAGNGVRVILIESPDRFARDLAVQLLGQRHRRGTALQNRLAAAALDALRDLAVTGRLELKNQRRLFELGDGAEHLPH